MDNSQKTQKGFNDGYLLSKYKPDLYAQLQNGLLNNQDPYVEGLLKGAKQLEIERSQSNEKKSVKDSREEQRRKIRESLQQKNRDNGKDRDRGR